jgi:hypothetical protein
MDMKMVHSICPSYCCNVGPNFFTFVFVFTFVGVGNMHNSCGSHILYKSRYESLNGEILSRVIYLTSQEQT